MESYITHVRIQEDAAYPSSPPPPNSDPSTKKERLVIVAVRKSGRVRMHKARENVNGTFSIGKTWQLDDLSAVQSYNGSVPTSPLEEQHKAWAGGVGFIVTIGKPYYWQANTQKEKQFFIASLVKIFTKYTGGKNPELIGFDAKEMDQLLGVGSGRSLPPSQAQSPAGSGAVQLPAFGQGQNRPPRRDPSREPAKQRQMSPGGASSFTSQSSRTQILSRGGDSPSGSFDSDRGNPQPNQPNQANLRRLASNNPSQESFARSDESGRVSPRSRPGMNGSVPGRYPDRSLTPSSQRAATPDSNISGRETTNDAPPVPSPLTFPPERRRPPMPSLGDPRQRAQNSADNIVPAPLISPGMRREDMRVPARNNDRIQPREPDSESRSIIGNSMNTAEHPRQILPNITRTEPGESISTPETSQSVIISPVAQTPEEQTPEEDIRPGLGPMFKKSRSAMTSPVSPETPEDEDLRPGLGPMIRQKKSKADIASTFLKAANATNSFNTFKPRAGGAAERLREAAARQAEKSGDGPDGITGVIPAPSLLRGTSNDLTSNVSTPTTPLVDPIEKMSPRKANDKLPEVKVTVPLSDRPSSLQGPLKQPSEEPVPEKSKVKEVKRQKPASETMQKELAFLGIDPSILGGRGNDLVAAWDEFGWVGEGVHIKNIDQMKEEIERELNKVQAGGWLTRLDEEDERISAIHTGLDKCIDECDQLDGLLTLYLVELSVSSSALLHVVYLINIDSQRGYCLHRSSVAGSSSPSSKPETSPSRTHITS
jgi:hypothetical protein